MNCYIDVSVFYDAAHVCLCVRVVFMDNDEILRFQTSSICKYIFIKNVFVVSFHILLNITNRWVMQVNI